ncbi:MAG TPA: LytTR family DNA-binding domain-containing protein [Syntrophomonadaceae bacterium]|nr:LytTR family DNA-binding domain-containing protein [Syntrophomonadaceae bacterium]
MPVKVLIVDDDERERIVLRYMLNQINDVEVVGEAVHGLDALLLCQQKKIDLVFLDITMPEMGGLETARRLQELREIPLFVFVTAKREMAVNAYEMGALDYIVKPVDQQRLEKTIKRAKLQLSHKDEIDEIVTNKVKERINYLLDMYKNYESHPHKLPVREKGRIMLLDQDEIIYCESQGKKVYICTGDEGVLSNYTLNELESRLDRFTFFRAHQAFIVNISYVREIINFGEGSYLLHLNNSKKNIILSRSRAKMLRKRLGIE